MDTINDIEVGGIRIRVVLTPGFDGTLLAMAYAPFAVAPSDRAPVHGIITVTDATREPSLEVAPSTSPVAHGFNDLGESRLYLSGAQYSVGVSPCPGEEMRFMTFARDFRSSRLALVPGHRFNRFILDSMLRIFFSQIAVLESSFLIHASAIVSRCGAHMFMGRSGTGKSTHSALWTRNFPDCTLLNDDNPLVRVNPRTRQVTVHGTPWSGKTRCWINHSAPLISMTKLRQAPRNHYQPLAEVEAFVTVLPGVSVIAHARGLYSRACDTLRDVIESVRVGCLSCRPDLDAACTCRRNVECQPFCNE